MFLHNLIGFSYTDNLSDYISLGLFNSLVNVNFSYSDSVGNIENVDYINSVLMNFQYDDSLGNIINLEYSKETLINYRFSDTLGNIVNYDNILNTNVNNQYKDTLGNIVNYDNILNTNVNNQYEDALGNIVNEVGNINVLVNHSYTDNIVDPPRIDYNSVVRINHQYTDLLGMLVSAGVAEFIDNINNQYTDLKGIVVYNGDLTTNSNINHYYTDLIEEPTVGWVEGGTEQEDNASPDECNDRGDIHNVKSDYEYQPVECYWDDTGNYLSSKNLDEPKPACETGAEYTSCVEIEDLATGEIYYNCTDYYAVTSELVKIYYTCEVIEQ